MADAIQVSESVVRRHNKDQDIKTPPLSRTQKDNEMSRKHAIDEKCKDCIYDPLAGGTWRQQVENCTSPDCPLYPYRPISAKKKPASTGKQPEGLRRYREQAKAED